MYRKPLHRLWWAISVFDLTFNASACGQSQRHQGDATENFFAGHRQTPEAAPRQLVLRRDHFPLIIRLVPELTVNRFVRKAQ